MVVTHSNPKGLKMPLITGSTVSAQFDVLDKIVEISGGIRDREAIKTTAPAKQPKAWQDWFKKYDRGVQLDDGFEDNDNWQQFVGKKYDEWLTRQGTTI